jgi:hypothetical protein
MKQRKQKPGTVAANRIPIFDQGVLKGAVTPAATSITVARFIGRHGATLGKHKGRVAWIAPSASSPTLASTSASGTTAGAPAPVPTMKQNRDAARGSVKKGK